MTRFGEGVLVSVGTCFCEGPALVSPSSAITPWSREKKGLEGQCGDEAARRISCEAGQGYVCRAEIGG